MHDSFRVNTEDESRKPNDEQSRSRINLAIQVSVFIGCALLVFNVDAILRSSVALAFPVTNCTTEDPFNYSGTCILDSTQLTASESTALGFVQNYATQSHISPALIMGIIKQESPFFDPHAEGDGGLAIGYMQLHWDAAYDAGYRSSRGNSTTFAMADWPTDGLNGDRNIRHGVGYLGLCHDQHGGSPTYGDPLKNTISCYNLGRSAGPNRSNERNYVTPVLANYNHYLALMGPPTTHLAFTDPSLFQSALSQQNTTTFDNFASNTPILNGTIINGASYNFNVVGGFHGLATNLYLPVSSPNTLGVNRSSINSFNNNFFFPGDSVTLTFANPTRAIGAYFSTNPIAGTADRFLSISTPVGTAVSGTALPMGTFGFPANSLRFVGLTSDQPFSSATLGISNPSPGNVGFVTDNITVGIPRSTQEIYHSSLNRLSSLDLTNTLSQNLGLNIMDTSLTTAHSLAGPLIPQNLHIDGVKLFDLGLDLYDLINLVVTGVVPDPLFPFGLICPPGSLLCGAIPGSSKEFSASLNELFDFSLSYEFTPGDSGLFHIGDRYFLDSPIFSDHTFSVASLIGLTASTVTFRFEGVSVLPEASSVPESSSILLLFTGLLVLYWISHARNQLLCKVDNPHSIPKPPREKKIP